nr:hypothetical protein GGBNIMDK_00126 [Bacillus cereus]
MKQIDDVRRGKSLPKKRKMLYQKLLMWILIITRNMQIYCGCLDILRVSQFYSVTQQLTKFKTV